MLGHFPELVIILVVALIVFGPEKLPEAAANAGKAVRELRQVMNSALHPEDDEDPEDFSTYYYESVERSGEDTPDVDEDFDPYDAVEGSEGEEVPTHTHAPLAIDTDSEGNNPAHEDPLGRTSRTD